MLINIQDDIIRLHAAGLLTRLLADKTTGRNIMWATDVYAEHGTRYERNEQIMPELITGTNTGIIKTRARKAFEQQTERTRRRAEVFTPLWICRKMTDRYYTECVTDSDPKKLIDSRQLEITSGEAPFLVSRYDTTTGEIIPIAERIGLLDRKLRIVGENVKDEKEWLSLAKRAYESTYGYEFQGDNLLIARVNLIETFAEYMLDRWQREPTANEMRTIINIIVWNLWQMDGLSGVIPYHSAEEDNLQLSFFDVCESAEPTQPPCRIYDWRARRPLEYNDMKKGMKTMKFDFVIGNPPYQDEGNGELRNFAPPIYDKFMESAFDVADVVELIHPARFLFNAGSTPKDWNKKMLEDEHFKVIYYEADSDKVFPSLSTPIKGGIAITTHSRKDVYGAIHAFTPYNEINDISRKVVNNSSFSSLMDIVYSRTSYRLTDTMHKENPTALSKLSNGHAYDMASNIFQRLPDIFFSEKPTDGKEYIKILGRDDNQRVYKYIRRDYVNNVDNLNAYKVYVPQANGSGMFGEAMSQPVIEGAGVGATETFISIGKFDTRKEAEALEKYIKTKFARAMWSILKVTQNGNKPVWRFIPMQDFTQNSDIDWSKSIPEIDKQLYAKYGLTDDEITFIETHVKEMS